MTAVRKVKRTEADMLAMLRVKFPDPQYALLPHVADGTGYGGSRTMDALVMSVWPSRGFDKMGMEIKVSRSDWLRELRQPEKADGMFLFMDRWYIVASDRDIVGPGELPSTWGLIAPAGGGLTTVVEAPKLDPKPIDTAFLASILRNAARRVEFDGWDSELQRVRRAAFQEGQTSGETRAKQRFEGTDAGNAIAAVEKFQEATGVDLRNLNSRFEAYPSTLIALAWVIKNGGYDGLSGRLRRVYEAGAALMDLAETLSPAPIDSDGELDPIRKRRRR